MKQTKQTIIVHRLMNEGKTVVDTLISTDRIILANADDKGDFTWLRYEVSKRAGKPEVQSWRVTDTLEELSIKTNALSDVSDCGFAKVRNSHGDS